jgi:glutamate 5-kinase
MIPFVLLLNPFVTLYFKRALMQQFNWQRAVIKIGSALIAPDQSGVSGRYLLSIARFISHAREQGKEVVLVSSGSVAAGRQFIGHGQKATISEKQAMAAIGQTQMIANWARFFDFPCAQVLLTYQDLRQRSCYVNIKNTLRELLNNQVLPIVNENDTVAIDELKVGDNDNLAAYTALVSQADTLIICSNIDGLYAGDPTVNSNTAKLDRVEVIDDTILGYAGQSVSQQGTGGMHTKLQAAQKCTSSGIQTMIVNGTHNDTFEHLTNDLCPGTYFVPQIAQGSARNTWLKYALKSQGAIYVDKGAMTAIMQEGASLLPSGIVAIEGQFKSGEAVEILVDGRAIAKGLSLYSKAELEQIKGLHSTQINSKLGYSLGEVVVHRDDLVLL